MEKETSLLIQFGQKVRDLRLKRELTQEQLAALCDLDRTYISGIERGRRNIGLLNISAIASALSVQLSELFEDM